MLLIRICGRQEANAQNMIKVAVSCHDEVRQSPIWVDGISQYSAEVPVLRGVKTIGLTIVRVLRSSCAAGITEDDDGRAER